MGHGMEVENCYIGRESGWHQLGDVKGEFLTRQDIDDYGITFNPFKAQLEYSGQVIDSWGVFHPNGTFIANCGEDYEIHPPSDIFDTMDEVMDGVEGTKYETAGILGTYQKVWGLADVGATIRVGDDIIQPYLAGATSFDGSMSTKFWQTFIRIVCGNTFNRSLASAANMFNVRHTSKSHSKLRDARAALAAIYQDFGKTEQQLNFLASRTTGGVEETMSLLDRVLEMPVGKDERSKKGANILAEILEIYEFNDNNAFPEQRGTCYNLLNAVTDYTDHLRSTRARDEENRDAMRSTSALFGSGDKLKSRALEVITDYAQLEASSR